MMTTILLLLALLVLLAVLSALAVLVFVRFSPRSVGEPSSALAIEVRKQTETIHVGCIQQVAVNVQHRY